MAGDPEIPMPAQSTSSAQPISTDASAKNTLAQERMCHLLIV